MLLLQWLWCGVGGSNQGCVTAAASKGSIMVVREVWKIGL